MITALAIPITFLTFVWPLYFAMLVIFLIAVGVGPLYYGPAGQSRAGRGGRGCVRDHLSPSGARAGNGSILA